MRVAELYELISHAEKDTLMVKSGYNGKTLCKIFNPEKHREVAEREVSSFQASIKINLYGGGTYARPFIECYVVGDVEYRKEHEAPKEKRP